MVRHYFLFIAALKGKKGKPREEPRFGVGFSFPLTNGVSKNYTCCFAFPCESDPEGLRRAKTFTRALLERIRCGVPSTCPAVGNQREMLLICSLGFQALTTGEPLKRMDPFKLCVSIIGLLPRFVPEPRV